MRVSDADAPFWLFSTTDQHQLDNTAARAAAAGQPASRHVQRGPGQRLQAHANRLLSALSEAHVGVVTGAEYTDESNDNSGGGGGGGVWFR